MKHEPPPLHAPTVGLVVIALIISHATTFGIGIMLGVVLRSIW